MTLWGQLREWAGRSLIAGVRRLAARVEARVRRVAVVATNLRARVPRCGVCGTRVERYIVVHEPGEMHVGLRITCHGKTRVREIPSSEIEGKNLFALYDWLALPAFEVI